MAEVDVKPVRCGCGGEAKVCYNDGFFCVRCSKCGIETNSVGYTLPRDFEHEKAEAITAWNKAMGERKAKAKYTGQREAKILFNGKCECGYDVAIGEPYCPNCGARLDWSGNE